MISSGVWSHDLVLEAIVGTLREREKQLREEQAVYGLDALAETGVHALLGEGLASGQAFGVLREQAFPSTWETKRKKGKKGDASAVDETVDIPLIEPVMFVDGELPLPRDRQRCDLVLLPEGMTRLNDTVKREKSAKAIRAETKGTLFESHGEAESKLVTVPAGACEPEDAYWLEFKLVGQQSYTCGVPGPNRSYASELQRSVSSDLAKLSADRRVRNAAAALILMTCDEETAKHDLTVISHRLLDRGLPIQSPLRAGFGIVDRIGNGWCTVMLVPLSPIANAFL